MKGESESGKAEGSWTFFVIQVGSVHAVGLDISQKTKQVKNK